MKACFVASCAMFAAVTACGRRALEVHGQVTYESTGAPFPGAKVRVGQGAVVTADGQGRFTLSADAVPYDLTAVAADATAATIYVGLTRKDPVISLSVPGGPAPVPRSASVSGHLGGGLALPLPAQHQIVVVAVAPASARAGIAHASLGLDGNYSLTMTWQGDANLSATLNVLEWSVDRNGNAVAYDAAVGAPVTVADGASASGVDLNLATVGNSRLAGTISTAPGYTLVVHQLYAVYSRSLILGTSRSATLSADFDYPAFTAPGFGLGIRAIAQGSNGALVQAWRVGAPTGAALTLPAAPLLQVPATAVTTGSTFSWSPLDSAVYHFEANPESPDAPALDVITPATSVALPDLSAMGLSWPKSASYGAFLFGVSPRVPDDVAAGQAFAPQDQDGLLAIAASSGFTTAP